MGFNEREALSPNPSLWLASNWHVSGLEVNDGWEPVETSRNS